LAMKKPLPPSISNASDPSVGNVFHSISC